jgi:hypothetical protein
MATAVGALAKAEASDGYRAACAACPINSLARANDQYTPFFAEKEDVERLLAEMDRIEFLRDTDVVIMHETADNGYPHTRAPNVVALPIKTVVKTSTAELAETLRHEGVHIHQRRNYPLWSAACIREGWWPTPQGQIPARFRARCRINPDTFSPQPFWSWEGIHVPLPLFTTDSPRSLADVDIKWLDLRNQALYSSPPPSFQARYGATAPQPEHPFELLAVEAAREGICTNSALRSKLIGS